jgi:hypothetical protein
VGVADFAGTGRGVILAAAATGPNPDLALVDPLNGVVKDRLGVSGPIGLRIAGGDVDGDGRDEMVVSSGWGGDGVVRILDVRGRQIGSFSPYPYPGWGMNVAVAARVGLPIVAEGRTLRLVAGRRTRVIVARFRDASGQGASGGVRASINWGDGTAWNGGVRAREGGVFDVRSSKRYARPGRYALRVELTVGTRRSSIARSVVIVRRR